MEKQDIISQYEITSKIYTIREKKVMLDHDLAKLYCVETRVFNQAVKRNINRFPEDFMFQLSKEELKNWISQFVTSNPSLKMGLRKPPLVFTEQGVAMLSSILNSDHAIQVNIQIMRTFIKIKEMVITHKDLQLKIQELEEKYKDHDQQIRTIFEAIRQLLKPPHPKPKSKIGFL